MSSAPRWAGLMQRVDSDLLDCVSDDLALLLVHAGVADVRTPFAQDWRFDLDAIGARLPRLILPPTNQDELLARRTGWRPRWRCEPLADAQDQWAGHAASGRPVLVVADSWHLDWLPYYHHEHLVHGFLVDAVGPGEVEVGPEDEVQVTVVDPYRNVTAWGAAEPTVLRKPVRELSAALPDPVRWAVLEPTHQIAARDDRRQLADNAAAVLAAAHAGAPAALVSAHSALDVAAARNLALQTWLLVRSRGLHARWLADIAQPERPCVPSELVTRFDTEVVRGWRRASESAYLAQRRAAAGRSVPRAVLDIIETTCAAEAAFAADLAALVGIPATARVSGGDS